MKSLNERDTKNQLEHYVSLPYPIELVKDEDAFVASIPDLPGCASFGETPDQAVAGVEEAKRLWMEGRITAGQPIPEPSQLEQYSGKFVLRIPRTLHRSLDLEARKQGVSLNQYLVHLLSERHTKTSFEQDWSRLAAGIVEQCGALYGVMQTPGRRSLEMLKARQLPLTLSEPPDAYLSFQYAVPIRNVVFTVSSSSWDATHAGDVLGSLSDVPKPPRNMRKLMKKHDLLSLQGLES